MVYYTFYTSEAKSGDCLVVRTTEGWKKSNEATGNEILFFEDEHKAKRDFMSILFDNEEFRFGSIMKMAEEKPKKEKKQKSPKKKEESEIKHYQILPDGFKLELNKVYNLDCLKFMGEVPDNFFDYIITSPPYNVVSTARGDGEGFYGEYADKLSDSEYEKWLFNVIDECIRTTKKHVFFNIQMLGANKFTIMKMFGRYAYQIKDIIIWNKKIAPPHINPNTINSKFEFIVIFSKDNVETKMFSDANWPQGSFNNVLEGMNASGNQYSHLNKATFPLYLPRTIIQKFGKKGDIVYDPFSGTGTTFHACLIEDRNFVGTEIDIDQCAATNRRIIDERAKLKFDFFYETEAISD